MASPLDTGAAPLGVSIPGVARPAPIDAISHFERALARNLRQSSTCGRDWVRRLLDDPASEAEEQLAALIADSGGRGIRENEANLLAQLQAASERAELHRRALETLVANAHLAPANYTGQLRDILTAALGRAY